MRHPSHPTTLTHSRQTSAQYTYTRLPSFPSQAESFHHASSFSPTTTLSLVVANVIPASPPPPSDPLLAWLTTADPAATPPPAPSTASLDVGVTAALYTAHLAFHHFRASAKNDDDDDEDAGRRGGHLLFLAPRAYVVDGGVGPDALAAGAAAAGFRSVVRALRAVTARKGKGGAAGVVEGVRVNLVAVEAEGGVAVQGREDRSTRGEEGTDEKERKDGNEEEVKEERERERYKKCVDAVMRVVCDEKASGMSIPIRAVRVRRIWLCRTLTVISQVKL